MALRQDYRTPRWLFDILNEDFGPFTLDAFADKDNALCASYLDGSLGNDGFDNDCWSGNVFANPPFAFSGRAVVTADLAATMHKVKSACMLLQAGISTRWFHDWACSWTVLIPNCRINYESPDPALKLKGFNRDSIIVLFGPKWHCNSIRPYYIRKRREAAYYSAIG